MEKEQIVESISCCGLICELCHLAEECEGCRSEANTCGKHLSQEGCFQRTCCLERGYRGCWECKDFPCDQDMYSSEHSPKIKAFARFIRERGAHEFAARILANLEMGLDVRLGGDYDNRTEEEVLLLISNGNF